MTDRLTAGLERDNPDGEFLNPSAQAEEEDEGAALVDVGSLDRRDGVRLPAHSVEEALDENCLPLPPGKEPWRIRDLSGLEWAFKCKAEADKEAAENLARAETEVEELEKEIARLRERAAAINEPLVKRAAYFESHIRVYAEQNRAELLGSSKRKSRKFLHGELAWRAVRAGYRLEGSPNAEKRLLGWAMNEEVESGEGSLTRVEISPKVDAIKAVLESRTKTTGQRQMAPGLEYIGPGETLEVKTGEE